MNSKSEFPLSLKFKIPQSIPKEKSEKKSLSPEEYAEFIQLGLKILPDIKKERKQRIENAPKVRFKL